jgi:membrane fusion protein, copper/silver efflux system
MTRLLARIRLRHRWLILLALVLAGVGVFGWLAVQQLWRDRSAAVQTDAGWTCPMHPDIHEREPGRCPKCGMALVRADAAQSVQPAPSPIPAAATAQTTPAGRTDLTLDLRRRQLIGVRTTRVERGPLARSLRTVGAVRYDERRIKEVNVKIEGWVRDLRVNYTGHYIRAGDLLFTLYSPDLLTTQQEYLLALRTRDQMRDSQVADAREQADRLVQSARERLLLWDIPADLVHGLEESRQVQPAVPFRSPVSGYVIEKQVLEGMRVMPGLLLYKVADLSVVWIEADVHESEMPFLRIGAKARVTFGAWPGETFDARIAYVYPYVDETTRTMRVRLELRNTRERLKPGMFATVSLDQSLGTGLTVPRDAILDSGAEQYVFVSEREGYFEPRRVRAGARLDGRTQILDGLREGEEVASGAVFFLDSESQLRATLDTYRPTPGTAPSDAPSDLQITFRTEPDPPRAGENILEAVVLDSAGRPVSDAQVTVLFYMAPMPSMNMPAMRSETRLSLFENGVYRAPGTVLMSGRWDVIVTVGRGGERLGSRQFSVSAK